MNAPCSRRWELDALMDGRLAEKERASLERHVEGCSECMRWRRQWQGLEGELASLPFAPSDELGRRRQRALLLARANEQVLNGRPSGSAKWAGVFIVVAAFAAGVLVWFARSRVPGPPPTAEAPTFEIESVRDAAVTTEKVGSISRANLRSGTAAFHVEHVRPGARFLVSLPDGEVEVRGTRFVVEVVNARTRSVRVTEGFVDVRVAGQERTIYAGEEWTAPVAAVREEPPPVPSPPAEASATARPSANGTSTSAPPHVIAGDRFGSAMRLYSEGQYGRAIAEFERFAREFPSDSRAEDALYLTADAYRRLGEHELARRAAERYLQRYPGGLRAPEAQRMTSPNP